MLLGLARIVRASFDVRGEIANKIDLVIGKHEFAEFGKVQPTIGGILTAPIVQIEAVNVDVCLHLTPRKSRSRSRERLRALPPKQQG